MATDGNKTRNKTLSLLVIVFLIVLTLPTFWRMLRPGIYTMHDFHVFRLFEFDKCLRDLQIPCRWAPDAGFGYGEPMFNFYGQLVYLPGQVVRLVGASILNSVKFMFILSLVGSAVAMFFLSRQLWGNTASGILSAILYVYAPYRAVDIWVRGALPEATAFIIFPIVIYFLNDYFVGERRRSILVFSLLMGLLGGIHNLSLILFLLFLIPWLLLRIFQSGKYYLLKNFLFAALLSLGLLAFYLVPLVFEKQYITLGKTTQGYYFYQNHFVSLEQLLFSRFWGYGGSIWGPNDSMSFAIGYFQWGLSLVIMIAAFWIFIRSKKEKVADLFPLILFLFAVGWFALFLTHGRSQPIWKAFPFLAFIQFPWRWLSIGLFAFSLLAGAISLFVKRPFVQASLLVAAFFFSLVLEGEHFREDIWRDWDDQQFFSGSSWQEQIASAVNDFWPIYGEQTPTAPAPTGLLSDNTQTLLLAIKKTNYALYRLKINGEVDRWILPIAYFPGWKGYLDGRPVEIGPSGPLGLITLRSLEKITGGEYQIEVKFSDTPPRRVGNLISLFSLGLFLFLLKKNGGKK